jgi:hypothetical protein
MLKIKEGITLHPYGPSTNLTSESVISQEALAHLQTRYPDDIEGELEEARTSDKDDNKGGGGATKTYTKAQMVKMSEKVKDGSASPEERELVAAARAEGKL